MKLDCDVIRDLLPLYMDNVCSEKSKKIVEEHLSDCLDCKSFYDNLVETEEKEPDYKKEEYEQQKVASFKAIKNKLLKKQVFFVVSIMMALLLVIFITVGILDNRVEVVEYQDNISVSMVNGDLTARLQGSQYNQVTIKRVTVMNDGLEENYLFFYMNNTKWDALTTGHKVYSEQILCFSDKGADEIDAVYYYTGDYTDIENMSAEELQMIKDESVKLWMK